MDFARLARLAAETVEQTQEKLPPEVRVVAEAVPIHYEARPDASVLAEGFEPDILGLFTGHPYGTEFAQSDPAPPQILLYMNSLWDYAEQDPATFQEEVRLTYLHELGHYLGWDEEDIAERGLD